jgi:antitoxin component YwqK of YwqJK toxin-antitoxin module
MKRLLNYIIILSLSLVIFGCDSSGPTIDRNSDEGDYIETTKKGIVNYKGVPFSGTLVEYYKNGQLKSKTTFKEGKGDGVWESYYENGQLEEKRNYKDGEKVVLIEIYYKNGQLKEKITYKDGRLDGVREGYDRDGTKW